MTDKQIYTYLGEAAKYDDPDAFASDVTLSILNPDDPAQDADMALFKQLRTLWHVACDPFRQFLDLLGLTQTQCSVRFCIPLRTVQSWAIGERISPHYIRLMMAELTGALNLRG